MRRVIVSALMLASLVGVSTTGCFVAAGDDRDGWRRHDRDRWERRDGRSDRRDGRWERHGDHWEYQRY
jgi:hypothetical protein